MIVNDFKINSTLPEYLVDTVLSRELIPDSRRIHSSRGKNFSNGL